MDENLMKDLGAVEAPSLTLDFAPAEKTEEDKPAAPTVEQTPLSEEERKMVQSFAQQIDLKNSALILNYGAASQKKIADFSGAALESVRTKDLGEVGDMITGLVTELRGFDASAEQPKGIFGLFKKAGNQLDEMKTKYAKAETNVENISSMLEKHQVTLLKDIKMLDKMYEKNLVYFKELTMYILAGKQKLEEARRTELPALVAKAQASGLPEDAQAARDFEDQCSRFEKKLYDLELTRSYRPGPAE